MLAIAVFQKDAGHFERAFGETFALRLVEEGEAFFGEFGEVDFPSAIGEFFGVEFERCRRGPTRGGRGRLASALAGGR